VLAGLVVAGILILFTLALTWIAVIPGLTANSADGASAFAYPLIFLPFISIWIALAWLVGGLIVAYTFAMATYRRKISEQSVERRCWHWADDACLGERQWGWRIEVRDGRAFEVMIYGTYDAPNDPTSGFLLWIFVRPKAVSAIPVVRWLLSARATVVAYE
jgi:hypothetical protein